MQDDEIALFNACTDLVSLKKCEAFPRRLLKDKRAGQWIGVRDYCQKIGLAVDTLTPELFAAWLPDPMQQRDYVVIVFYDDDSKWSMAAQFNRKRLARQIVEPDSSTIRSSQSAFVRFNAPAGGPGG